MLMIMLMCFISMFLLGYAVLAKTFKQKDVILVRLGVIERESVAKENADLNKSIYERIIQPVFNSIAKYVMSITPKEFLTKLEQKITAAGKPYGLGIKEWMSIQLAVLICLPAITAGIGFSSSMPMKNILLYIIMEAGTGILLPNFILSRTITKRHIEVIKTLPDMLDLLTISVEAGLGFDSALTKVIEKMEGALSQEFAIVLQEIKVGKPKKDALRDMSERLDIEDVTSFVNAIIQAEKLGISIGNVLRVQSDQMRQKRKQRAQEKAMKAPVKMLIPMIIFIVPTIFIVLLGPIVLRVIKVFAS